MASLGAHLSAAYARLRRTWAAAPRRDRRELQRELNDALEARLATAEARLADPALALADWDRIEAAHLEPAARVAAWRLLYAKLLAEHERLRAQFTGTPMGQSAQNPIPAIRVDVAAGELIDRLTILEIKLEHITDPAKLRNVRTEYDALSRVLQTAIPASERLAALRAELKAVNQAIWDIEDRVRDHERRQDFGPQFVAEARSVYRTNDRRAALKRQINDHLGSAIVEEKSYAPY